MTIKVLVVDDSALIRQILSEIIKSEPDMALVGAAPDAFVSAHGTADATAAQLRKATRAAIA